MQAPSAVRTLPGGIDSRCYVNANLPVPSAPQGGMVFWYRPEGIPPGADGGQFTGWKDDGTGNKPLGMPVATRRPYRLNAGLGGLVSGYFNNPTNATNKLLNTPLDSDSLPVPIPLGNRHTLYVVAQTGGTGVAQHGPWLLSNLDAPGSNFRCMSTFVRVGGQLAYTQVATIDVTGQAAIWAFRRSPGACEVWVNGLLQGIVMLLETDVANFVGVAAATVTNLTTRRCWISEVLGYDWPADDANHVGNMKYLGLRYGITVP